MNASPEEQNIPEVPAPRDCPRTVPTPEQSGPAQPEPGDVVISADQIDKLKAEKRQAARAEVEKANDPSTPEAGASAEERSHADGEEPKKPRAAKKEPPAKESAPPELSAPERIAPHRPIDEGKLVYLKLSELHTFHPFRDHPFQIKDDDKMGELVGTIKEHGVMTPPATVRPEKDGQEAVILRCL